MAIALDKRIETVVSVFGTSVAGGVFVPVNPVLKAGQVAYILRDCSVRVLVTTAQRLALLREELADSAVEHVVLVDKVPEDEGLDLHDWQSFGAGAEVVAPEAIDVDMAAIFYTSGSTGKPKGVVLSHRNLLTGGASVSQYLANHGDDVILAALPLSFDAGFSQLTTAFTVGAHVVLVNYLLPADIVRLCAKHEVTGLTCVPPLWIQLTEQEWPAEATRSLRYFANTGGRMPRATLTKLREIFPQAKPYLMYGLTEAFRSTYLDPAEVDRRPDSIGKAIPNAEILVVRPDGTRCEPGEEGELVHRGALVALGYWNDPERTAVRFRPAPGQDPSIPNVELAVWSGDLVRADEEGFLYFVGRNDEMIKTSGYRVSPTEIEEVAYSTGLVRDAVALGVEDPRLGQRIVLVVSPANGELDRDQVLAALKQQLPRLHGPQRRGGPLRAAALAEQQVRPQPAAPGAGGMSEAAVTDRRRERRVDCDSVGGIPLDRLAERVGGTPFFAYDRRLLTERIELLRATLPAGIDLSYAVKANPMPAVVQHLSGLVDSFDVASAAEMLVALDTPMPSDHVSFAGPGKTPGRAHAGDRRRRDDRDGVRDRGRARGDDRRAARNPAARRRPRQPRLPGQGLRDADGRRAAAVRRRRRDGAGAAGPSSPSSTSSSSASTSSPGRRTSTPRSSARPSARPSSWRCALADSAPAPVRYLNLGGGFGIPYFDRDQPLDLGAIGENLQQLLGDQIRPSLPDARVVIELGRYIVGECGFYVTRVVDRKESRGKTFLVVDGGLHHQLAASGNFGQVIRRNYPVAIGNRTGDQDTETVSVVGCLCTPLDLLADGASLPRADVGDLVVVVPGGRLRADRQPNRISQPSGAGRGAGVNPVETRGTNGTE